MAAQKKRLVLITLIFWALLLYVIAALVWWFISLDQQNSEMTMLRLQQGQVGEAGYLQYVTDTLDLQRRNHIQYIGEGITFMMLIIIGAVFVYRATRRQLRFNQLQQNFMMAITHELKTPISVIRLNVETLRRHRLDAQKQDKLLESSLQETDRLNDLCNNILLASRMEGGEAGFHQEKLDLTELVKAAINRFGQRFPQRQISFDGPEGLPLSGEPMLLTLLVNNLLENALKYSPDDKPVGVTLARQNNHVVLRVADQGEGINEFEKSQIFNKFYRIGNESTRTASGTGLGLYLCKKIMEEHGGSISVSDNLPTGAVFEACFN